MRDLRLAQGVSQSALAEALGVSRQTINAIENERYDPSLPLAFAIAKIVDQTIEAIFTP
ncbi:MULTISPECIES: helix-turn-helix transcriptional regulator [Asaia]|uniref:helix-turn-helix transcriptional regulator n=1 Tax=Asaia TaxID=91914 RepID=UPI002FC30D83